MTGTPTMAWHLTYKAHQDYSINVMPELGETTHLSFHQGFSEAFSIRKLTYITV